MINLILLVLLSGSVRCAAPDSPRTVFQKSLAVSKQLRKQEQKNAATPTELLHLFTKVPAEKLDKPLSGLKQQWDAAEKKHHDAFVIWNSFYPPGSELSGPLLSVLGLPLKSAQQSLHRANKDLAAIEEDIKTNLQKSIESD